MNECCSNCIFYRRLKHNFKRGVGFEESHCCAVWLKMDDDKDTWVQEVSQNDRCEFFEEYTDNTHTGES